MGELSPDLIAAIIGSLIGATYLNILWEIRKLRVEVHAQTNRYVALAARVSFISHHLKLPDVPIHDAP